MQLNPTYSYLEFINHIKICNSETCMILLELLCEECNFYDRQQRLNLYANLHNCFKKFQHKSK